MAVISHFHCFTQRHSSQHSADVVSKLPNANLVHAHSLPRSVPLWTQGSLARHLSSSLALPRTDALKGYRHKPGVKLISERVLRSQAESWWAAWRQFFF